MHWAVCACNLAVQAALSRGSCVPSRVAAGGATHSRRHVTRGAQQVRAGAGPADHAAFSGAGELLRGLSLGDDGKLRPLPQEEGPSGEEGPCWSAGPMLTNSVSWLPATCHFLLGMHRSTSTLQCASMQAAPREGGRRCLGRPGAATGSLASAPPQHPPVSCSRQVWWPVGGA